MTLSRAIKGIKKAETLFVSPKVEAFLREHKDGARWDEGTYALIREITEAWKANTSREGRFGASGRGKCLRRQIFSYLGLPTPKLLTPETLNLFNDGKWRHLKWQVMAMESEAITHVEHVYASKKWRVAGRMDGLNSYDSFGLEIKGDRLSSRALDGVPHDHELQIHTMMLATGWDTFVYIIEDKSTNDWREIIVRRDPKIIEEVKQELEVLNEHVEYQTLPIPLPACQKKEGPYRSCPYAKQCLQIWNNGDYWPD